MKEILEYYSERRLKPNHIVSQWYMCLDDLQKQVEFIYENFNCKSLMFLGDGDGVSILLTLLLAKRKSKKIKQIYVFDIDEREINLYKKIAQENNVSKFVDFKAFRYNVFDKVPKEYKNLFDAFYINPPYSSTTKPKGIGFVLWLERCIEMCKTDARGCIVYPVKYKYQNAIVEINKTITNFLHDKNFKLIKSDSFVHCYEETDCISKNIIVQKTKNTKAEYRDKDIPLRIAKSLYHNDKLPHYILDDNTTFGYPIEFDKTRI